MKFNVFWRMKSYCSLSPLSINLAFNEARICALRSAILSIKKREKRKRTKLISVFIENVNDVLFWRVANERERARVSHTINEENEREKRERKSLQIYDWINRMVDESNFDDDERMVLYPNYLLTNNIVDPEKETIDFHHWNRHQMKMTDIFHKT